MIAVRPLVLSATTTLAACTVLLGTLGALAPAGVGAPADPRPPSERAGSAGSAESAESAGPAGPAQERAVMQRFASRTAAERFRTPDPGLWRVSGGSYVLRAAPGAGSWSWLEQPVRTASWRLQVAVQPVSGRAGASVAFSRAGERTHAFVHLDPRRERSGIFLARGGQVRRVAALAARAVAGREQRLEIRRTGSVVEVHLARSDGPPAYVGGTTTMPGPTMLTAGLGGRSGTVAFDDLAVFTVPAPAVAAPVVAPVVSPPAAPPVAAPAVPVVPSVVLPPVVPPVVSPPVVPPVAPPPAVPAPEPPVVAPPGGRDVRVDTSQQLSAALAAARPGDVITMADGTYTSTGLQATTPIGGKRYSGTFVGQRSGTAADPIVLQGSRRAVIDGAPGGDGTTTRYGVYLAGVSHWRLRGFTVTNVAKGIVLDRSEHSVIEQVEVHRTGQEAIHLRAFSSDNVVRDSIVRDTGLSNATYGEGIYVGSAKSNWGTYSGGAPDASDRNRILDNDVARTSAESMDIKEGTTGGLIRGNRLDGAGMSGSWADSWIDLKGNGWLVEGNLGTRALKDGFQVHVALAGWGRDNVFRANTAAVDGPGHGFWLQQGATGNRVECTNTVTGARAGFATTPCS